MPGSSAGIQGINATGDCSTYSCNSTAFQANPQVCEVGDLSGKYGELNVNPNEENGTVEKSIPEESNISMDVIQSMSIVVHCNDGTRAFCASLSGEPASA